MDRKFIEALRILGDETRIRILKLLEENPIYLCQLAGVLGLSPSTVSIHLSKLKQFRFVESKKEGCRVRFSLSKPPDRFLSNVMEQVLRAADGWSKVEEDRKRLKSLRLEDVCPEIKEKR